MLRIIRGFKTQGPSPLEEASESVPGTSLVMLSGLLKLSTQHLAGGGEQPALGSDLETPPAQLECAHPACAAGPAHRTLLSPAVPSAVTVFVSNPQHEHEATRQPAS